MSFNLGTPLGSTSTPNKANFSFGAPSAFGTPVASAPAPTFGTTSTFGAPNTIATSAPAFGFAATATTNVAPTFGGFGNTAVATVTSAPAFGFGPPTQTSTIGGSFTGPGAAAPAFGALSTTPNPSAFGIGSFGSNFGGFNATAPKFPTFNSNFTTTPSFSTFGQPQQQQQMLQPQQPLNPDEALSQSIFNVSIFGDERDTVIAKLNYLQAMWGTGKSFYSLNAQPVEITPQNYFCRFKTIGYNKLPGKDNKLGLISFIFNKPASDIKKQEQQFIIQMNQVFGNKPNITVVVDAVKPLSDQRCQLIFYVEEKSPISNETKRVPATEAFNFLNQPMTKTTITNMGVEKIIPLVMPDEEQIKEYIENPPRGIDPRMWKQAYEDNPDPNKFIPIPIIGFNELQWRIKCQEVEADTHQRYLVKVQKDMQELKQRHASTTAKIMEHKRKLADLSHRILNIIVKQESTRKMGVALSPEEEIIRSKLENMQALVSAPTQFKGRLSELLSQMRMQKYQWSNPQANMYTLDSESSEEMKAFLTMQQKAMEVLIETVNNDLKSLKIISDGLRQMTRE